ARLAREACQKIWGYASLYLQSQRILNEVMAAPDRADYSDLAIAPQQNELEVLDLYHATRGGEAALARKRREDEIRVATKAPHGAPLLARSPSGLAAAWHAPGPGPPDGGRPRNPCFSAAAGPLCAPRILIHDHDAACLQPIIRASELRSRRRDPRDADADPADRSQIFRGRPVLRRGAILGVFARARLRPFHQTSPPRLDHLP